MTGRERPTVLVVDDDPDIRQLFACYLEDTCRVRTAESGAAALREVDDSIDAVLLDRRMVHLSGDDVLERLRDGGFSKPVAMVTAVEPDFDVVEMGFDDYVVKPVDGDRLRDIVETLLLRREYDDVIREYFALVSKVSAVREERSDEELASNETYAGAAERLEEIQDRAIAALETAVDVGKSDALFQDARFRREDVLPPSF